jgi:hypothetical protein
MNKYTVPPVVKTYLRAAAAAVAALFLADPNRPLRDYAAAGLGSRPWAYHQSDRP